MARQLLVHSFYVGAYWHRLCLAHLTICICYPGCQMIQHILQTMQFKLS